MKEKIFRWLKRALTCWSPTHHIVEYRLLPNTGYIIDRGKFGMMCSHCWESVSAKGTEYCPRCGIALDRMVYMRLDGKFAWISGDDDKDGAVKVVV